MGLARKAFSIATGGVVRYRSANQQTAHYAKKSYELQRKRARRASASGMARHWLELLRARYLYGKRFAEVYSFC
jgi:hypothetical protein